MNTYTALELATAYRASALQEMMAHAKTALDVLPEDDPRRGKWSSFYCGVEDMLQLMAESDMVDRAVAECERIRVSQQLDDWTIAAQAAAMAVGADERLVLDACRGCYE